MESIDLALDVVVYCLATFATALAWGMLESDKRSHNAINLSVVTRFTGALAFYADIGLVIFAFIEFPFPTSLAAVAASVLGLVIGVVIDPLRRNAMIGASNFLFVFAAAYYFFLATWGDDWLTWIAWGALGGASVLLIGAFIGPSMNDVLEKANADQQRSRDAIDELNINLKKEFAAKREQYAEERENERMRFLKEEIPDGYLILTEVPIVFRHWLPKPPQTLKDASFNKTLLESLRYFSVYLDIDFEDPYGGAVEVSYDVASRLYGTLDAYGYLPKSLRVPPQAGKPWVIDEEQWVDIVEALEKSLA